MCPMVTCMIIQINSNCLLDIWKWRIQFFYDLQKYCNFFIGKCRVFHINLNIIRTLMTLRTLVSFILHIMVTWVSSIAASDLCSDSNKTLWSSLKRYPRIYSSLDSTLISYWVFDQSMFWMSEVGLGWLWQWSIYHGTWASSVYPARAELRIHTY